MAARQIVNVRGGDAAVVGVVAVAVLGLASVVAIVAMFMVGLIVMGLVATVALTVLGGVRYARYNAETQAALVLWKQRMALEAATTQDPELRALLQEQLATPPKPRVALAMRRLQHPALPARPSTPAYDVTSLSPAAQRAAWWNR